MTRGQAITLLTLGCAGALAIAACTVALTVYFSPALYTSIAWANRGAHPVPAGYLALGIAACGVAAAVGLIKVQQALAHWLARRELNQLRRACADVEIALGTEKAIEFLEYQTRKIVPGNSGALDFFGDRELAEQVKRIDDAKY